MNTTDSPLIAILLACFNRRVSTLRCLELIEGAVAGAARYQMVIVDDGSQDGTAEAIVTAFPKAIVLNGGGGLYWNGGMRLAWQNALRLKPDYFLWLNDDTFLRPRAICDMLTLHKEQQFDRTIVVGCTVDPLTNEVTYGGYRRSPGLSRLRFRRLTMDEAFCDAMNGNCVLIPQCAVTEIGLNSEKYTHSFGDNDYGLRASARGYRIVELKNPVAKQSRNVEFAQRNSRLNMSNWKDILFHPKGVPVAEWWWFCSSHGGPLWPLNFIWRYLKMLSL